MQGKRPLDNGDDCEIKMGKHNDQPSREPRKNRRVSQPQTGFRGWEGGNKENTITNESINQGRILNRNFRREWWRPNAYNKAPNRGDFWACKCKNTTKHAWWEGRLSRTILITYLKPCFQGWTTEMKWMRQRENKANINTMMNLWYRKGGAYINLGKCTELPE